MAWNWQNAEWPNFQWNRARMAALEEQYLLGAGKVIGAVTHLPDAERKPLIVELMSREAHTTSEIEGEILNRDSVQSSIQRQLGLKTESRRVKPSEQGIAEMMVDLYASFAEPLTAEKLFSWHRMVTSGRRDLADMGCYRTSAEPMQVVSGPIGFYKVHFEAPPSTAVPAAMSRFLDWFARTAPKSSEPLPPITRAGIAHIYFESIHPFEDGNGRLGRAIAEKAAAQCVGEPTLLALSTVIRARQKEYYAQLEASNKGLDLTQWLLWFAEVVLDAQRRSLEMVEFVIAKTRIFDRLGDSINARQKKALLRLFREGPEGFAGGLSASNYAEITGASTATTTRDLADLVEKGALIRTGELRHARYWLRLG